MSTSFFSKIKRRIKEKRNKKEGKSPSAYFYAKLIKNHKYSLIIISHFYSKNKTT